MNRRTSDVDSKILSCMEIRNIRITWVLCGDLCAMRRKRRSSGRAATRPLADVRIHQTSIKRISKSRLWKGANQAKAEKVIAIPRDGVAVRRPANLIKTI